MAQTHTEQLVSTQSEDGYLLEGALFTPADGGRQSPPVVWMHGFTGRFYEQYIVTIARRLAARGHVFVTGNNRGHHIGANIVNLRGGPNLRAGGWWENFSDCQFDFSAWVEFAVNLGFPRVILVGHSLGALKAVTYMAESQDPRVRALVSASGPMRVMRRQQQDPERVALARRMVADGRGEDLLPYDGTPFSTSAQTLIWRTQANLDVYGLEREDPPIGRVRCPVLFILGSQEPEIGTADDLPTLTRNAASASSVETLYVEGADHVYTDRAEVVADGLAAWLARLPSAESATPARER